MLLPPLKFKRSVHALAISSALLALSACGGGSDNPLFVPSAPNVYALTSANTIVQLDFADSVYARNTQLNLSNVFTSGEQALDIATRNQDRLIYVLVKKNATEAELLVVTSSGTTFARAALTGITLNATLTYSLETNPTNNDLIVIASDGSRFTADLTGFVGTTTTLAMTQQANVAAGVLTQAINCAGTAFGLTATTLENLTTPTPSSTALNPAPNSVLSLDSSIVSGGGELVALLDNGSGPQVFKIDSTTAAVTPFATLPALTNASYTDIALITNSTITCP